MPEDGIPQIDTDQHQRRVERNRGKRVHRHSMWVPVAVEHRNYSDAGGKLGARPAVEPRVQIRSQPYPDPACLTLR